MLHIVDLGYSHHVVGNVLFQLCFMAQYLPQATTPKARLDDLWKRVVRHYRGNDESNQLGGLTLSMFCDTGAPYSHYSVLANRVKAAETRHFVPILTNVFESLCNPHDPVDKQILMVLQELSSFYQILEQADYILTPAQVLSLGTCVFY